MHHTSLNYLYKKRLTEGAAGLLALLALLTALTACQHDDEVPAPAYEDRYVPLQISIPASEALKRSPGDPGSDARLPLPDYLYVYTAFTNESGGTVEVLYSEYEHIREHWRTADGGNVYVYKYTDEINLPLIDGATDAYCYIIASADDLSNYLPGSAESGQELPKQRTGIESISLKDYTTLTHESPNILRDLYSSYKAAEGVINGAIPVENYGQRQSEVTGTLYHVAAKVDIQWNCTEEFHTKHPNAFVDYIHLTGLPENGYLFKPTQNTVSTESGNATVQWSTHPGNDLYGREDTYIWQPNGGTIHYTVGLKNGDASDESSKDYTITKDYTPTGYKADEVAYYRLRLTLTGLP